MNCPRCDKPITLGPEGQEFYGPCPPCLQELRDKYPHEPSAPPLKTPFGDDVT